MNTDDPFFNSDSDDSDRTVIRPSPGGRRPSPAASAPPAYSTSPPPLQRVNLSVDRGLNQLVVAAGPLLSLLGKLRNTPTHRDVAGLRRRMEDELKNFETQALRSGINRETVNAARYSLCTVIDEIVLNTPWGNESSWSTESLLILFHNEAWGGEKFFLILERMLKDPPRHVDMLELMYICLSMGFQGKYRVLEGGMRTLDGIIDSTYHAIRLQRGDYEQDLSPHWQGEEQPREALRHYVPLWVVGALSGVLLLSIYLVFSTFINQASSPIFKTLHSIGREAPPPRDIAVIAAPAVQQDTLYERISELLQPEVEQGLIELIDDYTDVIIRLRNKGLFTSGRAKVAEDFKPLLTRIAEAVSTLDANVVVAGHSDNVPIHTIRFPSNWHLSMARAEAVSDFLRQASSTTGEITAEGRADNEPLVPNDTPANRATNRRVEIILEK
ncbi:MAG: type IVB secretion system protein IcmH/DotU [Gammaproteobacteria bacterium]|nr:type IVB secretion system protein IcmH/DotU [Gammaproteobacteria bacterium]